MPIARSASPGKVKEATHIILMTILARQLLFPHQPFSCRQIREDPAAAALVDAWTWHLVGQNSDAVIDRQNELNNNTMGKPVFNNE